MIAPRRHRPVTTLLFVEGTSAASVHFHCPCGVTVQMTICNVDVSPPLRFTAALRAAHERGEWPAPEPIIDIEPVEDLDVVGSFGVELEDLEAYGEVFG